MNRMFHNHRGNDAPRSSPPFQQTMHPQGRQRSFQGNRQQPNMPMNRGGEYPQTPNQNMFALYPQRQMSQPIQRGPMPQQQPPNQQMFAPNQRQIQQHMQGAPMQPFPNQQHPPFGQQPYQEQPQQKGGLLSKLFRKSEKNNTQQQAHMRSGSPFAMPMNSARSTVAATSAATTASSGGFIQSLLNPGNLTSMLNNTQRVLQTAESFTPLVQQYGPMIKNIPSMWKLIRGLNAEDSTEEKQIEAKPPEQATPQVTSQEEVTNSSVEAHNENKKVTIHNHSNLKPHIQPRQQSPTPKPSTRQYREGESKPKLFM